MLWLLAAALACPLDTLIADLNAAYGDGRMDDALRLARDRVACATEEASGVGEAWLDLALVQEAAGEIEGALPAWAEVTRHLEPGPDRSSAWLRIGLDRGLNGDFAGGIADLERAVAEASEGEQKTDTQIWLARMLAKSGAPDRALALLETVAPTTDIERQRHGVAVSVAWGGVTKIRREAGDVLGALDAAKRSLDAVADQDGIDRVMAELDYGQRLLEAGRAQAAVPHLELAQEAFAKGAEGSEGDLIASTSLARAYELAGRGADALPLAERAVALAVAGFGPEHEETGEARHHLASVLHAAGRDDEAAGQYDAAAAILGAARGADDPTVLFLELDRLRFERARGRPGLALGRIEPLLARWVKVRGPDHLDTLATAKLRCGLLRDVGRLPEAVVCAGRATERLTALLGVHPLVVSALIDESVALDAVGDLPGALDRMDRALAVQRQLEPDPAEIRSLELSRARMLLQSGRGEEAAEVLGKRPPDAPALAYLWHQIEGERTVDADPKAGLRHMLKALELADSPLQRSTTHSSIGYAQLLLGQLEAAEASMRASLAASREVYGAMDPRNAEPAYNLAMAQRARKDHLAAAATLDSIVVMYEQSGVDAHPTMARAIAEVATMLAAPDDDTAGALAGRAVAIADAALGPTHPTSAEIRIQAGQALFASGKTAEALAMVQAAVPVLEAANGPLHPQTLGAKRALAGVLLETGQPDAAVALLDDLDRALVAAGMKRSFDRMGLLTIRAGASAMRGDDARAAADAGEALAIEELLLDTVMASSERQRLAAVEQGQAPLALLLSAEPDAAKAYERGLEWKGMASAAFLGAREPDPELALVRNRIAALAFSPPAGMSSIERRDALEALVAEKERLQAGVRHEKKKVDWKAVCKGLPADAAVVDLFPGHRYVDGHTRTTWEAFVLRGGACDGVVRVTLDAEAVGAARAKYRKVVGSRGSGRLVDRVGAQVREALWDPLLPALDGRTRVTIVPEARLADISFAGLPTADGRYLVEDYELRTVSHLRKVAAEAPLALESAVIVGGVEYGASPGADTPATDRSACGWSTFSALPGALDEAHAIRKTLKKRGDVALLTGADADEAHVREAIATAGVVHLATHGFHAGEQCLFDALGEGEARLGELSTLSLVSGLNPMLMSGLALAGANDRSGAADHDGVLTAEEVAGLAVQAELVVLSACESGLGGIAPGEGVMGLQRGFEAAGAKRIVYSLWQVPDAATQQLMVAFYKALADGATPAEALRAAQIAVLEGNRRKYGEGQPLDWAAFVVGG